MISVTPAFGKFAQTGRSTLSAPCAIIHIVQGELTRFLSEREASYKRLEYLLARTEHGEIRKFDRDELVELGHLYRLAAADLARSRYVLRSPLLTEYLNELVGRAHHVIHRRRSPFWISMARFIARDLPQTIRHEAGLILLATALIVGASIVGGIAYAIDSDWGQLALSQPELRQYEQRLESGPAGLATGTISQQSMPAASAFIITNNVRACVVAVAGGLLFGLGTLAALVFNGFLLGVIGTMFLSRGPEYDLYFWAGILPHGVLEIPAICIAGGAGFLLARGLLIPGKLSRGDALRREGQTAMKLLGGVVILLLLAGIIEGFITPLKVAWFPPQMKLLLSMVLFVGLMFYVFRAGGGPSVDITGKKEFRTSTHFQLG
jgi:uncharacterized membrane protein SpoIIM required for sporulation